jgi:hypothetical protein
LALQLAPNRLTAYLFLERMGRSKRVRWTRAQNFSELFVVVHLADSVNLAKQGLNGGLDDL